MIVFLWLHRTVIWWDCADSSKDLRRTVCSSVVLSFDCLLVCNHFTSGYSKLIFSSVGTWFVTCTFLATACDIRFTCDTEWGCSSSKVIESQDPGISGMILLTIDHLSTVSRSVDVVLLMNSSWHIYNNHLIPSFHLHELWVRSGLVVVPVRVGSACNRSKNWFHFPHARLSLYAIVMPCHYITVYIFVSAFPPNCVPLWGTKWHRKQNWNVWNLWWSLMDSTCDSLSSPCG